MPNYRSLVPGGYFSSDPLNMSLPRSIRSNNPGALNISAWQKELPGYVGTTVADKSVNKNVTTIYETPEHGVAAWYKLMEKYQSYGDRTIKDIITRYGGGQNYSLYEKTVVKWTGLPDSTVINLKDDKVLLPFAKAMFRYESGKVIPWSDAQILYGFNLARGVPPEVVIGSVAIVAATAGTAAVLSSNENYWPYIIGAVLLTTIIGIVAVYWYNKQDV